MFYTILYREYIIMFLYWVIPGLLNNKPNLYLTRIK